MVKNFAKEPSNKNLAVLELDVLITNRIPWIILAGCFFCCHL